MSERTGLVAAHLNQKYSAELRKTTGGDPPAQCGSGGGVLFGGTSAPQQSLFAALNTANGILTALGGQLLKLVIDGDRNRFEPR